SLKASVPRDRYEAIGRGHIAECQAHALRLATSAMPPPPRRTEYTTSYSGLVGGQPYSGTATTRPAGQPATVMEGYQRAEQEQARARLAQDAMAGCMAERGWTLV